jgi:hypothetical protein
LTGHRTSACAPQPWAKRASASASAARASFQSMKRCSALIERMRTPPASATSRMRSGAVPSLIGTPLRSLRIST